MGPFEITRLSSLMLTNDYRKGGEFCARDNGIHRGNELNTRRDIVGSLTARNNELISEVADLERMNELLLNAQRVRFGQSSEKRDYVMPNQLGMFNEAEVEQKLKEPEPTEDTITVKEYKRKKKRTIENEATPMTTF